MRAIRRVLQTGKRPDSRWSWVVCVASFFIHFLVGGISNSFGTMFLALLEEFKQSELETAGVGSLAIGMTYFCGPVSSALCQRFGCRVIACAGSVLFMTSSLITSCTTNIPLMYVTFGIIGGFALSLMYFSSLLVLIEYFIKRLSLANGIVLAGSGSGTLAFSFLLGKMCSKYGVHAGFKALAGSSVIGVIACLVYFPVIKDEERLDEHFGHDIAHVSLRDKCTDAVRLGIQWQNKAFVLWIFGLFLVFFAVYIPFTYLVQVAQLKGIPPSQGALLVGLMSMSGTVGKIVYGRIADLRSVNRLYLLQASLLAISIGAIVFLLSRSYPVFLAYALAHGLLDGGAAVLLGLITRDIVGKELMSAAVGSMYGVAAIPLSAGPPVAGLMFESFGSHDAVYYLAAALTLAGASIMSLIPRVSREHRARLERLLLGIDEHSDNISTIDDQKLAELLEFNSPGEMMLGRLRARLDSTSGSVCSRRSSSFVGMFGIVADDNYRDVSSYRSRLGSDTISNIDLSAVGNRRSSRQGSIISRRSSSFGRKGSRPSRLCSVAGAQGSISSRLCSAISRQGSISSRLCSAISRQGSISSRLCSTISRQGSISSRLSSAISRRGSMSSRSSSDVGIQGSILSRPNSEFKVQGSISSSPSSDVGGQEPISSRQSSEVKGQGSLPSCPSSAIRRQGLIIPRPSAVKGEESISSQQGSAVGGQRPPSSLQNTAVVQHGSELSFPEIASSPDPLLPIEERQVNTCPKPAAIPSGHSLPTVSGEESTFGNNLSRVQQ